MNEHFYEPFSSYSASSLATQEGSVNAQTQAVFDHYYLCRVRIIYANQHHVNSPNLPSLKLASKAKSGFKLEEARIKKKKAYLNSR